MPDKQTLVSTVGDQMAAVRLVDLGDGTFGFVLVGNVASGATDSGSPIKIGARFNTTPPTVPDGQRVDLQANNRGILLNLLTDTSGAVITSAIPSSDAVNPASIRGLDARASSLIFNGTNFDRDRKANTNARLLSAAASTNPTSVKASAGDFFGVTIGANAAAAKRYLKIYNKASAPTVGTDTPIFTIEIPASAANFKWAPDGGKPFFFSAGIAFALTTGQPDADTGALAAGDILSLNLQYH